MRRYIARFRGVGASPAETVLRIKQIDGATIVDESPRMMLIEAPDESALRAVLDPASWLLTEEAFFELPSPQQKVIR
jgi:hypothetical protein